MPISRRIATSSRDQRSLAKRKTLPMQQDKTQTQQHPSERYLCMRMVYVCVCVYICVYSSHAIATHQKKKKRSAGAKQE